MNQVSQLEYLVRTKSDLSGMRDYAQGLTDQMAKQRAAGESTQVLELQMRNLITTYNALFRELEQPTAGQQAFAEQLKAAEEALITVRDVSDASRNYGPAGPGAAIARQPGANTATSGVQAEQEQEAPPYQIRNQKEYEEAVRLADAYEKQRLGKALLGVEDEELAKKSAALERALSTERALTIAQAIDEAAAERSLAIAMNEGAAAAAKARQAAEELAAKQQATSTKQMVEQEQALARAYAEEADAQIKAQTELSAGAERMARVASAGSRVRGVFMGQAGAARELRSALVPLNQVLPGIANEFASQLIYGFNASTAAIAAGGVALREYYEDNKKFMSELSQLDGDSQGFARAFDKQREAVANSRAELAKFEQTLQDVRQAQRTATQQTEELTQEYAGLARVTDGVFKAREGLEKALAEATISDPIEKATALLAIETKFAQMAAQRADAEQKFLLTRQSELALDEKAASQKAQLDRENFQPAKERANANAAGAQAQYEIAEQQIEKLKQKMKEATDDQQKLLGIGGRIYSVSAYQRYGLLNDLIASYQDEIAKLGTVRDRLADPNRAGSVPQTKAASEAADARAQDLEERAKSAAQRSSEASAKFDQDRATAEQQSAGRYYEDLEKQAAGYLKVVKDIEEEEKRIGKEESTGKSTPSKMAALAADAAKLQAQLALVKAAYADAIGKLGGPAPTLFSGDRPLTESDLENPATTLGRPPQNNFPPASAPRPAARPDRNYDPGATGWDRDSEVGRLLEKLDYFANTGGVADGAKVLAAFEAKHARETELLSAIIAELRQQGERHAQMQTQIQSNN